jgi:hypothetical protein
LLYRFRVIGIIFGNGSANRLKRFLVEWVLRIGVGSLVCVLCINLQHTTNDGGEVLKKYFGPEFKVRYDDSYSLIISNHISWIVSYTLYVLGYCMSTIYLQVRVCIQD